MRFLSFVFIYLFILGTYFKLFFVLFLFFQTSVSCQGIIFNFLFNFHLLLRVIAFFSIKYFLIVLVTNNNTAGYMIIILSCLQCEKRICNLEKQI